MKVSKFLLPLLALALSSPLITGGCGVGGGGGGGVNPPGSTFYLDDDGSLDPGDEVSFSLSGTSNLGDRYTGIYIIDTNPLTTHSGQTVIPLETYFELTNTINGATGSAIMISYYDSVSHDLVKTIEPLTGVEYTPIAIVPLPDIAEINDFGNITSLRGTNGLTRTGTWRLEDAGAGFANFIQNSTFKDSFGNVDYSAKVTVTIDISGNPSKLYLEYRYSDGSAINLSGHRI